MNNETDTDDFIYSERENPFPVRVVGYDPKEKPVKRKPELSILVPVLLVLAWTILDIVGM